MRVNPSKFTKRRWQLLLSIFTMLALAGLVYALREQIYDTLVRVREVNGYFLVLMVPLQILNHYSIAKFYQSAFRIFGHRVNFRALYRTSWELNFVNTVFPSGGVSTFSYFGVRMKMLNITAGTATLVQLLRFVLIFIAFQVLILVGLLLLALDGRANNLMLLVGGSVMTMVVIGTVGLAYIIGSRRRINAFSTFLTRIINRIIHIVRPRHPETIGIAKVEAIFTDLHDNYNKIKNDFSKLRGPLWYALLANVAEVATIYVVYMAFAQFVNPGAVIVAYAIANFAGVISVLPGGIGIYEGLMTAVLIAGGVAAAVSIPVTVMYRILNMLIQLPVGGLLYYQTIHTSHPQVDPEEFEQHD